LYSFQSQPIDFQVRTLYHPPRQHTDDDDDSEPDAEADAEAEAEAEADADADAEIADDYVHLLSVLHNQAKRNRFLVDSIVSVLREFGHHRILVLCVLKKSVETLHRLLAERREQLPEETKLYCLTGDTPKSEAETIKRDGTLVIATYGVAEEGLDVPLMSTLLMAAPRKKVKQCVGRILRQYNGKPAVVLDVVDHTFPLCRGLFAKRRQFYRLNSSSSSKRKRKYKSTEEVSENATCYL
jgi:superfamily II DNA or RNA helicase